MHLEGPWLSTAGKKRGKQKFRNADAARKARELEASWEELKQKYAPKVVKKSTASAKLPSVHTPYRRETQHIPSLNSRDVCGVATKTAQKVYTGTAVKGIATMHKSNAVPVFSQEDAISISKMRR
jgi:hypothetical protein